MAKFYTICSGNDCAICHAIGKIPTVTSKSTDLKLKTLDGVVAIDYGAMELRLAALQELGLVEFDTCDEAKPMPVMAKPEQPKSKRDYLRG